MSKKDEAKTETEITETETNKDGRNTMKEELSREQLMALLEDKEAEIERLASVKGKSMPQRVLALIEDGYMTIDELANKLETNNKNISSNLTYIRQELRKQGKWLISSTIDRKTFLKIMTFEELGWPL